MNRFVIYGIVSFLFVGGLAATLDPSQINALRRAVGLGLLFDSEAPAMSGDVAAAVEEVAAEPAPGVLGDPPTLGEVATAVAACAMSDGPQSGPAAAALRRYVLAVAAIGLAREHPLADPRYRELYPLLAKGPMAALKEATSGTLDGTRRRAFERLHAAFRDPDHPLYRGLDVHSGTLHGLSFERAADAMADDWKAVAVCARERSMSPLAEWETLTPR